MMPDDDMGDQDNITLKDVAKGAIASKMDGRQTLENMKKTLDIVKAEDIDEKISSLRTNKD